MRNERSSWIFFPRFITCSEYHRINYLRCRQMATFVSRIAADGERMCESCARSLRAVDPSTRNLSRTQADLWLRFPWTFVIHSVSKSSWQLLSATRHWTILTFIPPVSCVYLSNTAFRPSALPPLRIFPAIFVRRFSKTLAIIISFCTREQKGREINK